MTHGLLLKYILSYGIGIACLNVIFFFTCFGGFLKQGFKRDISLFCLGRELYSIEGHVVLKDNGFILDRASFIRKLFWNKAYLAYFIIKRKQPVK